MESHDIAEAVHGSSYGAQAAPWHYIDVARHHPNRWRYCLLILASVIIGIWSTLACTNKAIDMWSAQAVHVWRDVGSMASHGRLTTVTSTHNYMHNSLKSGLTNAHVHGNIGSNAYRGEIGAVEDFRLEDFRVQKTAITEQPFGRSPAVVNGTGLPFPSFDLFLIIFGLVYAKAMFQALADDEPLAEASPDYWSNVPTLPIPVGTSSAPDTTSASPSWDIQRLRVRNAANSTDASAIAEIVEQAFYETRENQWVAPWKQVDAEELEERIQQIMVRKKEAKKEARKLRALVRNNESRLKLGFTTGNRYLREDIEKATRKLARMRFRRMSALVLVDGFVVNGDGTGEDTAMGEWRTVGCATISLSVPNALLPPPFPSSKPYQFYISNLAVRPEARRRGVGRALLKASETLCSRWGRSVVTLHVDEGNDVGAAMYRAAQYEWVQATQFFLGVTRRLLIKRVDPVQWDIDRLTPKPVAQAAPNSIDGYVTEDGTFVWGDTEGGQPSGSLEEDV
uniref:N-acetyltransferase domain-containing protein n=1 Tax=Eutreptiella gymnastica TaxID=73025 RepID=A0A7S1I800_9EUGL|mmetsp:Transcript_136570/g.237069  ORF Transcript_136570/g.237069 Transcript_136570/m.237069 type:complete len:509 (+) Transcript_136570:87-1613(+)